MRIGKTEIIIILLVLVPAVLIINASVGVKKYNIVKTGEVVSIKYLQGNWGANSKTILTFKDGASFVLEGTCPIPSKKIEILKRDGASISAKLYIIRKEQNDT